MAKPSYGLLQLDACMDIAKNNVISLTAHRVLWVLLAYAAWDGFVYVPQKAIAEPLGIAESNVARYLRQLESAGYINVMGTARKRYYRVDPTVVKFGRKKPIDVCGDDA